MSSLKNVGELFTAFQIFVVGTKLNASLKQDRDGKDDSEDTRVPKRSLAVIYLLRFELWPLYVVPILTLRAYAFGNSVY